MRRRRQRPTLCAFGATVAGPAHVSDGVKNQDACLVETGPFGAVIAVCDGLGSAAQSGTGAAAACSAVLDAIRYCATHRPADINVLPKLISAMWRARLPDGSPSDYNTTC